MEPGGAATLRDYLHVIYRRRWVVVGVSISTLALAGTAGFMAAPVYQASTTVTVAKTAPAVLLEEGKVSVVADQAGQAPAIASIAELGRSSAVRDSALAHLSPTVGNSSARAALRTLEIRQFRNTELVRITIHHRDPQVAAAVATAVAAALVDVDRTGRRQQVAETRGFIEEQLVQADAKLKGAEDALVVFQSQTGGTAVAQQTDANLQRLAGLSAQRVDVQLQIRELQGRITSARERLAREAGITLSRYAPNSLVTSLQAQLAALEIELAALRRQYTPAHPAVINTQAKIDEIRRRLGSEVAQNVPPEQYGAYQQSVQEIQQGELTLASLSAREHALTAAIDELAAAAQRLPARQATLVRLTRDAKEAEQIYLLLSQKLQEARIAEASIGSAIRVVDPAKVPRAPANPPWQENALLGGALGLLLAGVAVFLLEQLDDTVRSAEEAERVLGVPVLGTVPALRRARGRRPSVEDDGVGLVLPPTLRPAADDRRAAAEAFHILCTHLQFAVPGRAHRGVALLVTSAVPSEGKTFVAANMAATLALMNRAVWAVDTDLRDPALGRLFPQATAGNGGLAGVLRGDAQMDEIVRPASVAGLSVAAGASPVPNTGTLLSSGRVAEVIEHARTHAEVVILDGPPMLPVGDADMIGPHVDGIVVVVKAGSTDRRALIDARRRLDRIGVRVVGAVLNFVPTGRRERRLYYGYYHRNGRREKAAAVPMAPPQPTGTSQSSDAHR